MEREEFLQVYRHSLAHILAKAVIEMFGKENVQYAIGPQIADGLYYDFVLPRPVTTEDFPEIAHIVRNFQRRRHAPCIVHRTLAAAAAVPLDSAGIGAVPYLHGDADYLISLIFQKHSRDRRIHSAGHADYNPLFHFENPCCLLSGSRGQNARMGILPIRDIGTAERNTTSAL